METPPNELCILFLDVGQGDATIVLPPAGDPVVFDCGRDGWEVVQQLRVFGFERIGSIIASHLDLDHIGGMATVLDAYKGRVGAVYFSPDRDSNEMTAGDKTAKHLMDVIHAGDGTEWELREVHRDGRPIVAGEGWSVHVVAPQASSRQRVARTGLWEQPNIYSAVLRIQVGGTSILVGGDAPLQTWAQLPLGETSADVFRIPHHGGALNEGKPPPDWDANRLYSVVDPKTSVLSVGTNNSHGHPETMEWIRPLLGRNGCRLLCTQVTGRCHAPFERGVEPDRVGRTEAIKRERERWLPTANSGFTHFVEPPWRHYTQRKDGKLVTRAERLEVPCAGTISVRVDATTGAVRVDPTHESLDARVRRWTNPLCRPPQASG